MPRTPWLYIGGFGGFSFISYSAALPPSSLTTVSLPSAPDFSSGSGTGGMIGALVELPLGETFNIGARLSYQLHSGSLVQTYTSTDLAGASSGTVQGTVSTSFSHLAATLYGRVAPFSFPLYVYGGPTLLLPSQGTYNYIERIGGPTGAQFRAPFKGTSRTLANRSFTNTATLFAATAGIGYEHPLSSRLGLFGELQFQPLLGDYLSPLPSGKSFTGATLSILVGLRLGLVHSPAPPPPPPVKKDTTVARKPETGPFDAKGVTSGGLADTIVVNKKTVKATEVHALLPYIFFDRDSAEIPKRYIRLDAKGRKNFQVERLPRGNTLDIYYQLLNIVGQRIREDRVQEVTITGCVSQFEKDTTLARRRAEAVRSYLITAWRIPEKRLKLVVRGLPANPSLSEVDTAEAARENQRVEIASEGYVVERPVELPDTTFLAPLGTIRFLPPPSKPDTSGLVDGWSLDVRIGDSLIKKAVTGSGQPPKQIDYQIVNRPDLDLRAPLEISSTLTIRDTLYQDLARLNSRKVVMKSEGTYVEERNVEDGRYVDTYNLLLFSFDSSQATAFSQQASGVMKQKIDSTSKVFVVGHTDRIGLPYYNKALSQRRAEFAAQLLNLKGAEVVGMGEKNLLYDNQFPEGRYYSRTVTVTVETPIPGGAAAPEGSSRTRRKAAPQSEEMKSNGEAPQSSGKPSEAKPVQAKKSTAKPQASGASAPAATEPAPKPAAAPKSNAGTKPATSTKAVSDSSKTRKPVGTKP
ncbi:MAG TPA: OmpA family protein [Candidatus Kapabacteria bacterium]|nr:OmpA family protein [Candidatus Kapabacteria bacterium]